jgi:RNAse (barnase) inhibitor barstar
MSEREILRAARNQSLYREINEKIEGLNEAFGETLDLSGTWICECADENCTEPIEMTLGEYERLRSNSNRFAVKAGHVYPEVEEVVEEHADYVVVQKLGVGAEFAEDRDPRQP